VRATAGLAEGSLRRPHLVAQTRSGFEAPWTSLPQPAPVPVSANPANVDVVRLGMADTMQPGGTGWRVAVDAPYTMAGKTGTAQVISRRGTAAVDPRSLPMHLRHRALFIGFAPVEAPTIAVAIAVEGGGYGGSAAAPIARKIFDAWLLGKMPVPEGQDGVAPPDFGNVVTGSGPRTPAAQAAVGSLVPAGPGNAPAQARPVGDAGARTSAPARPDPPVPGDRGPGGRTP
jgi:penicillin-binding protein 2